MAAPVTLPFAHSERSTVGIEWEVALVDADSGRPAAGRRGDPRGRPARRRRRAPADHAGAAAQHGRDPVGQVPHGRPRRSRTCSARSTRSARPPTPLRIELMGGGTHPFAQWAQQKVTDKQRYATLIDRTQWWGRQMLIYGVHVHVGIEDRAKVLPISRAMLTVFAHIQSLSASSPFWGGKDTGLRLEPRAAVPAAAHRGPAVRVRRLVAARAVRRRHDAHRRDRPVRRGPLGRPPVAAVRDARDADRRRRLEPARGRRDLRADALLRRALLDDARPRRDPADAAAVVRAGEQVALGAVRHGRDHHHERRRRRGAGHRRGRPLARRARARRRAAGLRRRSSSRCA